MADFLERVVAFCVRRPWTVVLASLALAVLGIGYTVTHFRINTETTRLISPNTPWRQDEIAYNNAFPHLFDTIVAVIDGSTPEAADAAADRLVKALDGKPRDHPRLAARPQRISLARGPAAARRQGD